MSHLKQIITRIAEKDARHGKKLTANIQDMSPWMLEKAETFLNRYLAYIENQERDLDFSIDSYLWMINMMMYEQIQFLREGSYSCTSFADAEKEVYSNAALMEQYMHGLMLSQFLWKHHYRVFEFFTEMIDKHLPNSDGQRYLEIGAGHGLSLGEAKERMGARNTFHCLDISATSIEMARTFLADDQITYFHKDIFEFETDQYDFITMGEVLEHVEDPVALLKQAGSLLTDEGKLFVTTPTNAATIDHIYLFRNRDEIADVISTAGFTILDEFTIYSEDVSEERAKKLKVPMMFAAVIQRAR